ncbi:spermidine synthase [Acidobacteriota bacterium]
MSSHARTKLDLFLISFLALYLEIALIRWIPGHLRIIAYYTNFVLMASFLGLSAGLLLAVSARKYMKWVPLYTVGLLALTLVFKGSHLRGSIHEIALYEYFREIEKLVQLPIWIYIPFFFVLVSVLFVPLGQIMGDRFRKLEPIPAYIVNLGGSIAGIAVFSLFSFFRAPPTLWFAIGLLLLLPFLPKKKLSLAVNIVLIIIAVVIVAVTDRGVTWSPYYKITFSNLQYNPEQNTFWPPYMAKKPGLIDIPEDRGMNVSVNDDFLQFVVDLSDDSVRQYPFLREVRHLYSFPFKNVNPEMRKRALIVGAGCGMDVGQAIAAGFEEIDAVEIDPVIVEIGKKHNPQNPYGNPRVNVHTEDARAFFHKAEHKYDLILFSYLASHRLFSNMSNIRLDSYIYTLECFREARDLLNPDGYLVVSHALGAGVPWVHERLEIMLKHLFGPQRIAVSSKALMVARWAPQYPDFDKIPEYVMSPHLGRIDLPTDNWPFFYMKRKLIPLDYIPVMAFILLFSVAVVALILGRKERWGFSLFRKPVYIFYFFLGAAFMLLETKSVTELALVFGSSWFVNSVVFAGILIMILFANLLALKGWLPKVRYSYVLLFASVVLNLLVSVRIFAGESFAVKLCLSVLLTFLPIFFAGLIFATLFRKEKDTHAALGYNLLGAAVGGVFEYLSLLTGFRALLYIIGIMYALSMIFLLYQRWLQNNEKGVT